MKNLFYILAAIFTIIALILAFENIAMTAPIGIFFEYSTGSLFFPLILLFIIGVFAGFFFALGIKSNSVPSGGGDDF